MADLMDVNDNKLSLMSLEDELTCSICLCPFDCPVTIPCGHNFCQDCLLSTWRDSYTCPQCRADFATKPTLTKNTVLSTVVEAFKMKSYQTESSEDLPKELKEEDLVKPTEPDTTIMCDTCMEAAASKTCLTCMASYCAVHLRPHQENLIFHTHQLTEPLGDLSERICPEHHKMMDFFCVSHSRCICSFCLQHVHKGCNFSTPDEQRGLKQSDLRGKLSLLDSKIQKNKNVISQMNDMQTKLKDSASSKKRALEAEYLQMRELLDSELRTAMSAVDHEQANAQTSIQRLSKKFSQNVAQMSAAKESINGLLGQSQTVAFLQASVDLPSAVTFDPYTPRITLDSKAVAGSHAFAAVLKEHLIRIFQQPTEARLQMLKPGEMQMLPGQPRHFRSPSPGAPLRAGQAKKPPKPRKDPTEKIPKADKQGKKSSKNMIPARSTENLLDMTLKEMDSTLKEKPRGRPQPKEPKEKPDHSGTPPSITSAAKRTELLQYGTVLTFDPKTAHKRIVLSEELTKATVSDEPANYPDSPSRFTVCTQVLSTKGFARGRHYWEVKMSSNNFIGIGIAYNSMDRKGPSSRMGRNKQSWCVEWFNVKLSAWHDSSETVLANNSPKRVGVLLDCEDGAATFYNVADRAYPFHTFVFPFTETVYPAFWIFSSGASVSLCKLQG